MLFYLACFWKRKKASNKILTLPMVTAGGIHTFWKPPACFPFFDRSIVGQPIKGANEFLLHAIFLEILTHIFLSSWGSQVLGIELGLGYSHKGNGSGPFRSRWEISRNAAQSHTMSLSFIDSLGELNMIYWREWKSSIVSGVLCSICKSIKSSAVFLESNARRSESKLK